LVGGIESVTLSDEEARRRGTQKTVLERRAPPTFDILIEIQDRQRLAIHRDVATAVDSMLRGQPLGIELRYRNDQGKVVVEQEEAWKVPSPEFSRRRGARRQRNDKNGGAVRSNDLAAGNDKKRNLELTPERPGKTTRTVKVFPYGVARNRLGQAAKSIGISIQIVDKLADAEVFVTLKNHFKRQRKVIIEAQNQRIPVYVLRANTQAQIENFLAEATGIDITPPDPFEEAIAETERAINKVKSGQPSVDLPPVSSAVRRYQHQLARQADLVSHSYGSGRNRHVRIYRTSRN
jgi:hypothetical protein